MLNENEIIDTIEGAVDELPGDANPSEWGSVGVRLAHVLEPHLRDSDEVLGNGLGPILAALRPPGTPQPDAVCEALMKRFPVFGEAIPEGRRESVADAFASTVVEIRREREEEARLVANEESCLVDRERAWAESEIERQAKAGE